MDRFVANFGNPWFIPFNLGFPSTALVNRSFDELKNAASFAHASTHRLVILNLSVSTICLNRMVSFISVNSEKSVSDIEMWRSRSELLCHSINSKLPESTMRKISYDISLDARLEKEVEARQKSDIQVGILNNRIKLMQLRINELESMNHVSDVKFSEQQAHQKRDNTQTSNLSFPLNIDKARNRLSIPDMNKLTLNNVHRKRRPSASHSVDGLFHKLSPIDGSPSCPQPLLSPTPTSESSSSSESNSSAASASSSKNLKQIKRRSLHLSSVPLSPPSPSSYESLMNSNVVIKRPRSNSTSDLSASKPGDSDASSSGSDDENEEEVLKSKLLPKSRNSDFKPSTRPISSTSLAAAQRSKRHSFPHKLDDLRTVQKSINSSLASNKSDIIENKAVSSNNKADFVVSAVPPVSLSKGLLPWNLGKKEIVKSSLGKPYNHVEHIGKGKGNEKAQKPLVKEEAVESKTSRSFMQLFRK